MCLDRILQQIQMENVNDRAYKIPLIIRVQGNQYKFPRQKFQEPGTIFQYNASMLYQALCWWKSVWKDIQFIVRLISGITSVLLEIQLIIYQEIVQVKLWNQLSTLNKFAIKFHNRFQWTRIFIMWDYKDFILNI